WGTSPSPLPAGEREMAAARLEFGHQTIREIVHTSIGGKTLRVRLTNAYGRANVEVGSVHLALRAEGSSIVPGSDRALTFGGHASVMIPPDAIVFSDPIALEVPSAADLAISLYLPRRVNGAGVHYGAQQTSYIAPTDLTASSTIPNPVPFTSWVFLA